MNKLVTHDMLSDLGHNIQVIFKALHPNGITVEELLEKANEYTFYRGIYKHVKEVVE